MSRPRAYNVASTCALAVLLILALGLRIYRLGAQSFWIDEVSSIDVAAQSLHDIVVNYRPGHHPWHGAEQAPLALIVMHFFLRSSAPEFSARFPSVLIGVATILVLFFFARQLFVAPIALLAATFLCLSPLHIWYSQEARWYAQWIFLTTLSYWAFWRVWMTGSTSGWLAYFLCSVLSVYTFILSFFVIASQGVSVLLLDRRRGRKSALLPRFVLVQVAVLVACAPVLWMILKTIGLTTGTPRPTRLVELPYTFFVYAAGYSAGPTTESLHFLPGIQSILTAHPIIIAFAVVFAPLLLLGVVAVLRRPVLADIILPWCFGPLIMAFVISLASHVTYQARYSSAALPAFVLLVAVGVWSLPRSVWRWGAAAAVCGCFLVALANYYWDPEYAREDVRDAVAFVNRVEHALPVAVVGQVEPAVVYYGPQLRVIPVKGCTTDSMDRRVLEEATNRAGGLWFMVGRDWDRAAPQCLQWLSQMHAPTERRDFPGVDLWLFRASTKARGLAPSKGLARVG